MAYRGLGGFPCRSSGDLWASASGGKGEEIVGVPFYLLLVAGMDRGGRILGGKKRLWFWSDEEHGGGSLLVADPPGGRRRTARLLFVGLASNHRRRWCWGLGRCRTAQQGATGQARGGGASVPNEQKGARVQRHVEARGRRCTLTTTRGHSAAHREASRGNVRPRLLAGFRWRRCVLQGRSISAGHVGLRGWVWSKQGAWACKAELLALFARVAGRVRCTSCRPGPVEQTAGGLPGWDSDSALSPGWSRKKK